MIVKNKKLRLCPTVRTRWIDYKEHEYDASQIEPGW